MDNQKNKTKLVTLDKLTKILNQELLAKKEELKSLIARRDMLKEKNEKQLREIIDLEKKELEERIALRTKPVQATSQQMDVDPNVEPNQTKTFNLDNAVLSADSDGFDDTDALVQATMDAIHNRIVKKEPDPFVIPDDPILLETVPVNLDGNGDATAENDIRKIITDLHDSFDWNNKNVGIKKFMDAVDGETLKKIFKVKCPECG